MVAALVLLLACAHAPMKAFRCASDARVRQVSLPRDCRAFYATELPATSFGIEAKLDSLAAAGVGAGMNLSQGVTQLSQQLDQLNVMYRDRLAGMCLQQHVDPCAVTPERMQADIERINERFLQARLEIERAAAQLNGIRGDAGGDPELRAAIDEHLAEAAAALDAVQAELSAAEAPGR
jgi:hypothetical protein